MFFAKVKRRAVAKAFASGNKHCCRQGCYSAAIQAQGYEECLQRNAPRMQKHFLFCLHFVLSLNAWNLNASVRGSSLFCWKILIFPQEAYIIYKTTSAFFTKDGRQSYSVWCLGKRKNKQMLLNYTKWIKCEGRRHLSRVQTTQDGDTTLFPMQLSQDVPSPQTWKETEMQLSGRLTFILTAFIPSTRKHALKITHTQVLQQRESVFIYLRSLLSNQSPLRRIPRVSTPASHKAPAWSTWVMVVGCSYESLCPWKGQRSQWIRRKYWEGKMKKMSRGTGMGGPWKWLQACRVDFRTPAK